MSRSVWAVFLAVILGLVGAKYADSSNSPSRVEGAANEIGGTAGVSPAEGVFASGTSRVHATTSTLSVKLQDLPVGKVIQIGDSTNGLKFVKVGENQYITIEPTCDDGLVINGIKNFDYTGGIQTFTACAGHTYKLEVWGAAGGNVAGYSNSHGGYGGYSTGIVKLNTPETLYVVVGGVGESAPNLRDTRNYSGGYNGGGDGGKNGYYVNDSTWAAGGGATHIAFDSGVLRNLSGYATDSRILIVAGGGGGSGRYANLAYSNGGGLQGNNGYSACGSTISGGTQNSGGTSDTSGVGSIVAGFGYGASVDPSHPSSSSEGWRYAGSGGGGGYYGGGLGYCSSGAAAGGSGYIASSNLISSNGITKHMTCYSCATSTAANTYTISNTCVNATATVDCAKTGNGYARITRLN